MRYRALFPLLLIVLVCAPSALGAPMPKHWHAPKFWLAQAVCIHGHEGAWNDNTGNTYFGGLQFLESTWKRAGGADYPAFHHPGDRHYPFTAPIREQLYRAWVLWLRHRHAWTEWGVAVGICGLR